jgi:Di- and tricarboxylate transporters
MLQRLKIQKNCKRIGKNIHQLNDDFDDKLIFIKKIIDQRVVSIGTNQTIDKGDSYLVQSDPTDLSTMMEEYNFSFAKEIKYRIEHNTDENPTFNEVILTPGSPLIGRTRTYLRRKTMNRLTLLAVARQDKPIHKKLKNIKFQMGDVLLLSGSADDINNSLHILDVLPLAERDLSVTNLSKAGLSILIFIFSIMLSMFNIVPTTVSFIGAIICYIFLGILPLKDLYKNIDWPVIVLLGAMIPLSNALLTTGTTELISNQVLHYSGNLPIWAILSFVMIATMTLSDVINNAATALIMAPISASIAMSLEQA